MLSTLKNFRNAKWFRGHLYAYGTLLKRRINRLRGKLFLYNCELFFDTRCNLKCEHCSIEAFQHQPNYHGIMSLSEIERVAAELKKLDCLTCCLVGGEPMLRKDIDQVVAVFHRRGILPTMITNGYFVTAELLARLKRSGLFSIGISLNGITPASHDAFVKREGAFERQLAAVDLAIASGLNTSIAVVPTHENVANGEYRKLIQFAVEKRVRVNVNYPALAGLFSARYDALLSPVELIEVREYFKLPNVTSDFTVMGGAYECPAGRKRIYVLPDGSVCPCTFIHISFGNILKEPLRDIMQRIWATKTFMGRPKICLTGESREFNERYLGPVFEARSLPLFFKDHPLHKSGEL